MQLNCRVKNPTFLRAISLAIIVQDRIPSGHFGFSLLFMATLSIFIASGARNGSNLRCCYSAAAVRAVTTFIPS